MTTGELLLWEDEPADYATLQPRGGTIASLTHDLDMPFIAEQFSDDCVAEERMATLQWGLGIGFLQQEPAHAPQNFWKPFMLR